MRRSGGLEGRRGELGDVEVWRARRCGGVESKEGEEVWSKAVDSSHNSQPETFENTWNLRGTLSHAYCRYRVKEGNALPAQKSD